MKRLLALILAALLILPLAACGSSYSRAEQNAVAEPSAGYDEAEWEMPSEEMGYYKSDSNAYAPNPTVPSADAKIIYNGNVTLESTDFDAGQAAVMALVAQYGGYIEAQESYHRSAYRYANFTVRVPSDQFYAFLNAVAEGTETNMTYQSVSSTDVSEQYFDLERRVATLETKIERLNELLAEAESMEDIITIESALSEAEYYLEEYTGQIRHYDSLIGYSTVDVSLNEVSAVTDGVDDSYGQRLARGFVGGLKSFAEGCGELLIWVVSNLLTLVVLAAIAVVVVVAVRRGKKKRKAPAKTEKKPEE